MCPLGHGTASGGDRSRSVTAPSPSRRGGGGSATLLPLPPAHPSTGADSVSVLIDTPVLSGSQPSATLTIGVTAPGGGPVAGDEVTLATIGEPEAACGTLQAASVTTDRSGQATLTYSRSATAGFCAVSATEQRTGQAGFVMVDQEPVTSASATRDTVAVAASGRSAAGGGSAAALTVAVETHSGAAVAGDAVWLTPYGVGCGSLSANVGITDGSGRLTVGYTAAAAGEGSCPNPMSDTPPRLPHRIAVLATASAAVLAAALYGVLFPIGWQAALDEQIPLWHVVLIAMPVTELAAMVVVPLTLLALGRSGQARRWFLGLLVCSAILSVLVVMFYAAAQAVV